MKETTRKLIKENKQLFLDKSQIKQLFLSQDKLSLPESEAKKYFYIVPISDKDNPEMSFSIKSISKNEDGVDNLITGLLLSGFVVFKNCNSKKIPRFYDLNTDDGKGMLKLFKRKENEGI